MDPHTVHTRASLLEGIQAGHDERWREFFRLYAPVIRGFALKAGLTEVEADEVVQETCIGVARNVGEFHYDPGKCRFKTWLLTLASWRVKNQFAKRQRWDARVHRPAAQATGPGAPDPALSGDQSTQTATIERLPDAGSTNLDALWDAQWRADLFLAALEQVQTRLTPTQFQVFDLNVTKQWPAADVAKSLGISIASVYLIKHRVTAALKKEVRLLERMMERGC